MTTPKTELEILYHEEAQRYLRRLTDGNCMESIQQAMQRRITLASLELVEARVSRFHLFNELLVQYPRAGRSRPGQVVPDNMVVLHEGELKLEGSYDVSLQPARPFWVMEYVSRSNWRKDYDDNMDKYEGELKVPYYLLFEPEAKEMTLYRLNEAEKYASVLPNEAGRVAVRELELEMAIADDWVRYWFRGELLEVPREYTRRFDALREELRIANERLALESLARQTLEAENARLRAELEAARRTP